jgi:signal transduction histidine kinase
LERLLDLERRSLLAEQAREQAHVLRTPLSVIDLVAETLLLELDEDPARGERLSRIKGAATTLTTKLADMVRATRFGDGPSRQVDIAALAANVVRAFGGEVADGSDSGGSARVEPTSFEAALVHALRLIGVGTDCNGVCGQRPVLHTEHRDGMVHLAIVAQGKTLPDVPRERADIRLMLRAAERAAQDNGGKLRLEPARAVFQVPHAEEAR